MLQVLIGHMGGPFWARKDGAAWSFPKGGVEDGEQPLAAALREFEEETGIAPPPPPYRDLGEENPTEIRAAAREPVTREQFAVLKTMRDTIGADSL